MVKNIDSFNQQMESFFLSTFIFALCSGRIPENSGCESDGHYTTKSLCDCKHSICLMSVEDFLVKNNIY